MDLYKTGMLVAMFLCVRGVDLCIYGPVQDKNVSGHVLCVRGVDLCIYGPVQDRNASGHVFVCQGGSVVFMDLYNTGILVALLFCVRGIDCIYGPVQDRNVSGHVFMCQGDRSLYLWTCTRQEC